MYATIIGSSGFVGQFLKKKLLKQGKKVCEFDLKDGLDIRDYEDIRNFLDKYRPQEIYHLAAQAHVAESFKNPQRAFEINTIGSINLLEAVKNLDIVCKIQMAGTSEEYGHGDNSEESNLTPQSPYAVSKIAMDYMGQLYTNAYKLHVVVTRAFNHTGAGRGEMYAESSWAKQIAEIEQGKRKSLWHGNLESVRNFSDVRDIVRAYTMAINLEPGVYNICSDNNLKMQEVLDILKSHAKVEIKTKFNKSLGRPSDFSFKPPSCDKFNKLSEWKPEIPIDKTFKDLLEHWRKNV